jgi:hypothetical protein
MKDIEAPNVIIRYEYYNGRVLKYSKNMGSIKKEKLVCTISLNRFKEIDPILYSEFLQIYLEQGTEIRKPIITKALPYNLKDKKNKPPFYLMNPLRVNLR